MSDRTLAWQVITASPKTQMFDAIAIAYRDQSNISPLLQQAIAVVTAAVKSEWPAACSEEAPIHAYGDSHNNIQIIALLKSAGV